MDDPFLAFMLTRDPVKVSRERIRGTVRTLKREGGANVPVVALPPVEESLVKADLRRARGKAASAKARLREAAAEAQSWEQRFRRLQGEVVRRSA